MNIDVQSLKFPITNALSDTALALCAALLERYSDNYSMVIYVGDVDVFRPEKF